MNTEINDIPHITKFLSLTGIFLIVGMMVVNISKSGYRFYYDNPNEMYAKIIFIILLAVLIVITIKTWRINSK